jgi:hypothetical protein
LEILDVKGKLDTLLHALPKILNSCLHASPVVQAAAAVVTASAVGAVTPAAVTAAEHTQLTTAVAAACRVIWKLATTTDLRRRLVACGAAQSLFAVAARLPLLMPNGTGFSAVHSDDQHKHSSIVTTQQHATDLTDDDLLSSTSIHCYGALAALMPSTAVKDDVAAHTTTTAINSTGNSIPQSHLHTLFDAAQYSLNSTACDMAATALAAALTTHAGCRIAAATAGLAPRLSTLMQHPRSSATVRLCAAASAHAFVRSEVDRTLLTAADCGPILVQAAALCGWAVEQLGSLLQQGHQQKAAAAAASAAAAVVIDDVSSVAAADSGEALLRVKILDNNENAHEDEDECDDEDSSNGSGCNGWKLGIAGESRTLIRILEQVRTCMSIFSSHMLTVPLYDTPHR